LNVPLILAVAGVAMLIVAGGLLRSVGPGLRIGRLLGGTQQVAIDRALHIAGDNTRRYVKVTGRISSDEEFPDDQNRPLVFRRTRLEIRSNGSQWANVFDEREAVQFGVETRSDYIAVDDLALSEGLVVIPRVSVGNVSDLPADFGAEIPVGIDPATPVKLTIEQLSAVEQATIVGEPTLRDGRAIMTAGTSRPLIVTTLDQAAAMRVLAAGKRNRVVAGAISLGVAMGLFAGSIASFLVGI
jgi:hypothetical protein